MKTDLKLRYFTVFFLSLLYFFAGLHQEVDIYDEGVGVYGAERVLHGELPYRDFWTLYAPGRFYALAAWFKLFDATVLAARVFEIGVRALLLFAVYRIAEKIASPRLAWFSWGLVLFWLGHFGPGNSPTFSALLLALTSLFPLMNFFVQKGRPQDLFIGGMLVGLTAVFRHDFGIYAFLSQTAVLALFVGLHRLPKEYGWWKKLLAVAKIFYPYLIGIALICLPVFLLLLSRVPLSELVYDLIVFPLSIFPKVRDLPYPNALPNFLLVLKGEMSLGSWVWSAFERAPFYFPLYVYLAVALLVIFRYRVFLGEQSKWWGALALALFGAVSFNFARVRSDVGHLSPMLIPAVSLFPLLLEEAWRAAKKLRVIIIGIGLAAAVSLTAPPADRVLKYLFAESSSSGIASHDIKRARGVRVSPGQAEAVRYVQAHVPAGEPIFVGNSRHDHIYFSDVLFYFLAERPSATKYHELHPGSASTLPVQKRIVEDLTQNDVRHLVLYSGMEDRREPNVVKEVKWLDNFIRENYRPIKQFGFYTIWKKNE